MPASNILRVSEYEKCYYDEATPFRQKHWEALCRYLQSENKYSAAPFSILNKGIQFSHYVGVIQVGNLTIEILPKTDNTAATASTEFIENKSLPNKEQWQPALVQMLHECRFLSIHHTGDARLNLHRHSILDIYFSIFLNEAERLLHEGLLKQYEQKEGNQSVLKGQLIFSKQLQHNSIHQERFYIRNSLYTTDNNYNRILYKALQLVADTSNDSSIKFRAYYLLQSLPVLADITVTPATFSQLSFSRKTERYREAMQIATLLLLNHRPDITGGPHSLIAILFDMNKLWEEWVYHRLKKEEVPFGITVQRQPSASFWEADHPAKAKTIRPDIVIRKNDITIILDTKWKLPQDYLPADNDLKQLFVYNLYWQCQQCVLLYPATDENISRQGSYAPLPQLGGVKILCQVIMQSIFKDGSIDADFGKRVLATILPDALG